MRLIEVIYAHNHAKNSGHSFDKSFLIKNGRAPDEDEVEFNNSMKHGIKIPHNVYWFNWICYSVQNILLNSTMISPSTSIIKKISQNTFGHDVPMNYIHIINKQVRSRMYDLDNGIYGVNVWQMMITKNSLFKNEIPINDKSISLLFNKIYKRRPKYEEIECCKSISLDKSPKEIRNEIKSIVNIKSEKVVSSRSK